MSYTLWVRGRADREGSKAKNGRFRECRFHHADEPQVSRLQTSQRFPAESQEVQPG